MAAFVVCLIFLSYAAVLYAATAPGATVVLHKKEETFEPSKKDCAEKGICDLKKVKFSLEQFRFPPEYEGDVDLFSSLLIASYETTKVSVLEKYAFVQFVRGCAYISHIDENGKLVEEFRVTKGRWFEGSMARTTFHYLDWTVDAPEDDPVFSSMPSQSTLRHGNYMWKDTPGKLTYLDETKAQFYGDKKPRTPRLYVIDTPDPAVLQPGEFAKNFSLEFKIALYKTADIPEEAPLLPVDFSTPIAVFHWSHNFVYNHQAKVFEKRTDLAPMCTKPLTIDEYRIESFQKD